MNKLIEDFAAKFNFSVVVGGYNEITQKSDKYYVFKHRDGKTQYLKDKENLDYLLKLDVVETIDDMVKTMGKGFYEAWLAVDRDWRLKTILD